MSTITAMLTPPAPAPAPWAVLSADCNARPTVAEALEQPFFAAHQRLQHQRLHEQRLAAIEPVRCCDVTD